MIPGHRLLQQHRFAALTIGLEAGLDHYHLDFPKRKYPFTLAVSEARSGDMSDA
jgi:hypothetical protein